jgi:maleate isomerase
MEMEIPAMLHARQLIRPERFAFHSSRMRMNTVSKKELASMDSESDRCALELSDAQVDILGWACLVAPCRWARDIIDAHGSVSKAARGRTMRRHR